MILFTQYSHMLSRSIYIIHYIIRITGKVTVYRRITTVEPPNKGHFGTGNFVLYREVVLFSECPLSEVPLYNIMSHCHMHVQSSKQTLQVYNHSIIIIYIYKVCVKNY